MFILLLQVLSEAVRLESIVGGNVELDFEGSSIYVIEYYANYKPISVKVNAESNIKYVLVSDKEVENPAEGCPKDSLYCSFGESGILTEQINLCVNNVYVHIFPKDSKLKISGHLITDYLHDEPCNDINLDPTNFCQLLPIDECLDYCSSGCGILECQIKRSLGNQKVFSICMPDTTPAAEQELRCKMHKDVDAFTWKFCGNPSSSYDWLVYLVVAFVAGVLGFGAVIFYYQKAYQKYGRPPFKVPYFCPRRLFPRRNEEEAENLRVIQ